MKTFLFSEDNGNAVITLSADNYDEAFEHLDELVKDTSEWRCEDEEGEDEDDE